AHALDADRAAAAHDLAVLHAALAQDAALRVEHDLVAELPVLAAEQLALDEAAVARAEAVAVILQRALAGLVADGAVERVVDEQELEPSLARLHHGRALGLPG